MDKDKRARKVEKLISEGDKHAAKGSYEKALKKYRKAHELEPEREGLHEKIIEAHEKSLGEGEWKMEDFAEHLDLVMQKQEHDHPPIKQTHAKLSPEWKGVSDLIFKILSEADDAAAGPLIEELVGHGELATRALIDFLRRLKKVAQEEAPHEEDVH
jgi:hypothetical protein